MSGIEEQYNELPNSAGATEEQLLQLKNIAADSLAALNHYCFGGKQNFGKDFRCLIVGYEIINNASLMALAEELAGQSAEVVFFDLVRTTEISKQAAMGQLDHVTWLSGNLSDIQALDMVPFDYIDCRGVLSHTKSPEQGLGNLAGLLKAHGAMLVTLSGFLGRHSILTLQSLLRDLLPEDASIETKLRLTKKIIKELPDTNIFQRACASNVDGEHFNDEYLYELLLLNVDHCFNVEQVYALAEKAALHINVFTGLFQRQYQVHNLIEEQNLVSLTEQKTIMEQQAIAEKICSNIPVHCFYLTKKLDTAARLDDLDNCLITAGDLKDQYQLLAEQIVPDQSLLLTHTGNYFEDQIELAGSEIAKQLLYLMDGQTLIVEIITQVNSLTGADRELIMAELRQLFELLHAREWLFIGQPSTSVTM